MQYCPNYSAVLHTTDNATYAPLSVYRTRCKQWDCEYCAIQNKRIWQARIMNHVADRGEDVPWWFWTITLDGRYHIDAVSSMRKWRNTWDTFVKRLKRLKLAGGKPKMDYLRIFETHKSGVFHVHLLANFAPNDITPRTNNNGQTVYESKQYIAAVKDLAIGRIHDIKPIITTDTSDNGHAANVASYLSKYLTKQIQGDVRLTLREGGLSRVRILQTSQGWYNQKVISERYWERGRLTHNQAIEAWQDGIDTIDLNLSRQIDERDFITADFYPLDDLP